jgi:YidC/Oxa1 family membrane protein insertase
MDRKSIFILVACFALLLMWPKLVEKVFPPKPVPNWSNVVATATNVADTNIASTSTPPSVPTPGAVPPAAAPVTPTQAEQVVVMNTDLVRYTFSTHWGGLKQVELLTYPEAVDCRGKKGDARPSTLNARALVPAMALLGGEALQGDGVFTLSQPAPELVRAEKRLPNNLAIVKEFQLATNYQLKATVRLENRAAQPLALPAQELVFGSATPMNLRDNGQLVGLFHYDGVKAAHIDQGWFANRTLGCFPGTPRTEFVSTGSNVVWAAVHNQFYAMIAKPAGGAPQIVAREVSLPAPTLAQLATDSSANRKPIGYQTAFLYPPTVLQPGQKLERAFDLYTGPKEYHTLSRLSERQDLVMNFGGFFGFFAKALLLSMNGLHSFGLGYGWAIVVITIVIKLLFWPLTTASTRSMKRMAKLQPQMNALKEKYKDDPTKMNQKLMEYMKENKVNPMGGCLPMVIQIPVFFGFYAMIQSAIELRGASFLWNCDLSMPDTLFMLPGLNFPFNLMPLLMGVTMLWQSRLTPASPGVDPTQQKIMKYMPLMFLVFLYNFSAGLTLYWTVQNLLTIAQMKLTKPEPGGAAPAKAIAPAPKKR